MFVQPATQSQYRAALSFFVLRGTSARQTFAFTMLPGAKLGSPSSYVLVPIGRSTFVFHPPPGATFLGPNGPAAAPATCP